MGIVYAGVPTHLVSLLQAAFDAPVFVETGTYKGRSTVWASRHFRQVITVEASEVLWRSTSSRLSNLANVTFLHGSSAKVLPEVVAGLGDQRAVFWLDAHWCGGQTFGDAGECPIVDEIEAIRTSPQQHIILIDDARFFLAPPPRPHRSQHWPGLSTLVHLLESMPYPTFIAAVDDVLLCVPEALASVVQAYTDWAYQQQQADLFGRSVTRLTRYRMTVRR
jgi:hypothetical protein